MMIWMSTSGKINIQLVESNYFMSARNIAEKDFVLCLGLRDVLDWDGHWILKQIFLYTQTMFSLQMK